VELIKWGVDRAATASATVSAEVASSAAAHHEQKRLFWADSRVQCGQRTIRGRSILTPFRPSKKIDLFLSSNRVEDGTWGTPPVSETNIPVVFSPAWRETKSSLQKFANVSRNRLLTRAARIGSRDREEP
jgi:hypothetical protein